MEMNMALTTTTENRIHPIVAGAAASVIMVCLAGTAAITGLLPSSKAVPAPEGMTPSAAVAAAYPVQKPEPVKVAAAKPEVVKEVHHYHTKVVQAAPKRVVKREQPREVAYQPREAAYQPQPAPVAYQQAPAAQQPNYLGIGAGALIGGLVGNQIGSGNGKKLATVAGAIGGGYLGNQIANQQQQR
jgi:uncharacterized protein YcfJ